MTAAPTGGFIGLVRRHLRPHLGIVGVMVALTFIGNVLTVAQPAVLAALLANLSGSASADVPAGTSALDLNYLGVRVSRWLASQSTDGALLLCSVLFVVAAILIAVFTYASESAAAWLRARLARSIQVDLVTHLLAQDVAFFSAHKSGDLTSRVTLDATQAAVGFGPLIRSVVQNVLQVVMYSAYLLSTSLLLTLGTLGLLTLQFALTQVLKGPLRRLVRQTADMSGAFAAALQEGLMNIRVAKSFGAEAFEVAKLRGAAVDLERSVWRRGRFDRLELPARSVIDALAILGILLLAIGQMRRGQLTFEGLILFTFIGRSLIAPINQLATSALSLESLRASAHRIDELMLQRPQVVDGPVVKTTFEHALTINGCSFAYGDRPAIDDLTLEIRKGEFVALVGPSGAGKSTLADLILRLRDPQAGEILIDGTDLRRLRQREYRRLFGVVSQENLLFHDTVRSNIRYGRDDVTDGMVEAAARAAHAHGFIMTLPAGYDTIVGERGVRLSGGERQRVAIARAIVHNPQILLLDEATSALDSESERLVQTAVNEVVEQTTAVVIAHRLSTVTHADRIVVLNQGRIEAIGRHQQLLASSRTYRRFCELQFGRQSEAVTGPTL